VDLIGIEQMSFPAIRDALAFSASIEVDLVDLIGIEPMTSSMPWKRARFGWEFGRKSLGSRLLRSSGHSYPKSNGLSIGENRSNLLRVSQQWAIP